MKNTFVFLMIIVAFAIMFAFTGCSKSGKRVASEQKRIQDSIQNADLQDEENTSIDTNKVKIVVADVLEIAVKHDSIYKVTTKTENSNVTTVFIVKLLGKKTYFNQVIPGIFGQGYIRGYMHYNPKNPSANPEIWIGPYNGTYSQGISARVQMLSMKW